MILQSQITRIDKVVVNVLVYVEYFDLNLKVHLLNSALKVDNSFLTFTTLSRLRTPLVKYLYIYATEWTNVKFAMDLGTIETVRRSSKTSSPSTGVLK